ncbi:MAG: hypothetical protein DRI54_00285 [Bacteroidetes bacterium]|nr:MAG: hypothetical protein DRI54_00285 [Bacteroidota bacterium]
MEILKFLSKALWITIIVFAFYWVAKYIYLKLKPVKHPFFYFHYIEKDMGVWKVKIEAPYDDFELDIEIISENKLLTKKNARLKAGMNNISIKSPDLESDLPAILKINSADQKLERKV